MKTLVGLRVKENTVGFQETKIAPCFLPALDFCRGKYKTSVGIYEVSWKRQEDKTVLLNIIVPEGARANVILDGYTCESSDLDFQVGRYSLVCIQTTNQ